MSQSRSTPLESRLVLGSILAVGLIGVFCFVLPRLAGKGKSKVLHVVSNLRQIAVAKEMWALDRAATNGTIVTEMDLARYFRVSGRTGLVSAIDGEAYSLNVIGVPPEAQLQRDWGSRFPKGTLIQWTTNGRYHRVLPKSVERTSAPLRGSNPE
jgi:hypothetical protein